MNYTRQIGGFILAGGESSRMGKDKALLEIDGVPVILRATRLVELVVGNSAIIGDAVRLEGLELRIVMDDFPGAGPLGAIATALRTSSAEWNLVIACDLPYLTREWLEFLVTKTEGSGADAVVPTSERGAEPLCAMYRKRCHGAIREALDRGTRKVTLGLSDVRTEFIEPHEWKGFDSDGLLFKNMNSPADYEEAKARLSGRTNR